MLRSISALFNRALVHVRVGNDRAALADLDLAISIDPSQPDLFQNRGLVHRRNVRVCARVCGCAHVNIGMLCVRVALN